LYDLQSFEVDKVQLRESILGKRQIKVIPVFLYWDNLAPCIPE